MDRRDAAIRVLFLFFVVALFGGAAAGAYGYFGIKKTQTAISLKEKQISELEQAQTDLKTQLEAVQSQQQKVAAENETLTADARRYEEEKNVILNQVRSSIGNFETFRAQATDEIARLKGTINSLEADRNAQIAKIQDVENVSAEEKARLEANIAELGVQIDAHKETEGKLVEQIEQRENAPLAVETGKLHYNLGNFYFRHQDYAGAAKEYLRAIWYQPNDADAHFNLAVVFDDYLGQYAEARKHYTRYIELKPDGEDFKKVQQRILDLDLRRQIGVDPAQKTKPVDKVKMQDFNVTNFMLEGDKK